MDDYPGGSQFPTLDQYYERVFREHRESTAIRTEQQSISYGTLDERTAKMANVFRSLGLGPDDLIGVLMGNRLEYLVTQIGAVRAGAVAVPLNNQLDGSELEQTLTDAQIQTLVVGPTWVEAVQSIQQSGLVFNYLIGIGDGEAVPIGFHDYQTLLAKADDTPPAVDQSPDDVAVIYYTGGTTGRPKGAMHTHSGLLLNIYNHVYELDIRKNERMLLVTPLGHSAGFFARAALGQGGQVLLQDGFDPECVLQTLDEERVSWVYLIPTMIGELLDHYGRAERSVETLNTLAYGSAPIPSARLEQGIDAFGNIFVQFYGLAEIPNLVTVLPKEKHRPDNQHWLESNGRPAHLAEVTIIEDEFDWGEGIGEVGISAPYEMKGYLNRDERLSSREWIRTGDVGRIDERGRLHVLDRIQDVIISDGKPVYSTEIEDVLQRCSAVRQVAVIGIPEHQDELSEVVDRRRVEQSVKAIVVPAEDTDMTLEEIRTCCEGILEPYQVPDSIDVVGTLPETPYGKINKRLLREPYW